MWNTLASNHFCHILVHLWLFNPSIIFRCAAFVKEIKQNSKRAWPHHLQVSDGKQQHVTREHWLHATGGYLIVGVALWIERGERRDWRFIQPLALLVRPRLIIKGYFRRFYLWCTDNAQHSMTEHTHTRTQTRTYSHTCTHTRILVVASCWGFSWKEDITQPLNSTLT